MYLLFPQHTGTQTRTLCCTTQPPPNGLMVEAYSPELEGTYTLELDWDDVRDMFSTAEFLLQVQEGERVWQSV